MALLNTLRLALVASVIGMSIGTILGSLAGVYRGSWVDRCATGFAVASVSGSELLARHGDGWCCSASRRGVLPAMGAGPGGSSDWAWDWDHMQFLVLPAITLSAIPMGIVARTVRGIGV